MKKEHILGIGILVVVIAAAFWALNARVVLAPIGGGKACTMEAKICPDGSAVGRTGPNCEFAECPTATATTTFSIGMSATINGTRIGRLSLVEDSRCPVDVQCIQAGTVRVRTSIDSYNKDFTFTLGQPQVAGNATITLASVTPAQKYAKQTVQPSDYRFTFTVVPKVVTIPPSSSGVRGIVSLGPTCPVERIPPDPQCADKPYATTIDVYRTGSLVLFATGKSDAQGAFEFAVPAGSYTLTVTGGTMLPRCASVDVDVSVNGYTIQNISCDTGIR